jgi:hypothetical protein
MGVGAMSGPRAIEATPRRVPWGVRARVVINLGVLIGGLLFGVGAAFALADDPLGHALLAVGARQSTGRPIAVEPTWFKDHGPIYRCRYTFQTPGGVTRRGVSFLKTRPGPEVVLEYSPVHPETSRIRGALPGLCPPGLAVVMGLVSLAGLAILATALVYGRFALRMLRIGEVGQARIVSCAFTTRWGNGEKYTRTFDDVAFEQFRQTWLAGADYPPGGMKWTRKWLIFWTCVMAVIGGFGLVLLMHLLGLALFGDAPIRVNDWPLSRATGIALIAGILVVFVLVIGWHYRFGRGAVAELSGSDVPAPDKPPPRVSCTYDFALPDGTVIRSKDLVLFDERFGAGPAETVLYDATRPNQALLVYSLRPGVRLSPLGEWESTGNWVPWLRVAAVVAVSAAAFALFA